MKKKLIFVMTLFILGFVLFSTSCLALGNYAVSIGGNYKRMPISFAMLNTTDFATDAQYWYEFAGYDSHAIIDPSWQDLKSTFSSENIPIFSSDVLYLAGHASMDSMTWDYKTKSEGDQYCGIWIAAESLDAAPYHVSVQDVVLPDSIKLVTLAGCQTGKLIELPDGEFDYDTMNIARVFLNEGARTAIGWKEDVGGGAMKKFSSHYNWALANGYTVIDAINYALNKEYYGIGSNIETITLYTVSEEERIAPKTAASVLKVENRLNPTVKNEAIAIGLENTNYSKNDMSNIEAIIKKKDNNFNRQDYEMKVNELCPNYYYITLTRKLGDVYTNSMYKIVVKNNQITEVIDSTHPINEEDIQTMKSLNNLEKEKLQKAKFTSNGKEIEKNILYYDVNKKEKQVLTYTTHIENNNNRYVDMTTTKID